MYQKDNINLKRMLDKKSSFYLDMEKVSRKFIEFQQLVYYSPIKQIHPNLIVKINGRQRMRQLFYIINGQYQPKGTKGLELLILQIVQQIPRPKDSIGIIYINTLANQNQYDNFKQVLQLLPQQYLLHLTKIYVLQPSFLNKAFSWLSFGTATNYLKNKTVNIDTLRQLSQQTHISFQQLKNKLPKNVLEILLKQQNQNHQYQYYPRGICTLENQHFDIPKNIHTSNSHSYTQNRTNSRQIREQRNRTLIFPPGGIKPNSNQKTCKELSEYQIGPTGSPIILEMLIYFFNSKDEYLKQQGLFRKSVSIDQQTQILRELNNKNYNYLSGVTNPHVIANAIKRFLSYLKTPIIPYQIFQQFMAKDIDSNLNTLVVKHIKSLPKINQMVIFSLFQFIKNRVLCFAEYNKMGINNICIVFGPCLMKSEIASIKDLIYAKKIIVVTNIIYEQFENIFGDKQLQMKMKRNSYKNYRKQQIKQRQSKQILSKTQIPNINQENEVITPTFGGDINLINRTSQFIKQVLQKSQQSQQDQIQKQQPIRITEIKLQNQICQNDKSQQKIINLFITPTIPIDLVSEQQKIHKLSQNSTFYSKRYTNPPNDNI